MSDTTTKTQEPQIRPATRPTQALEDVIADVLKHGVGSYVVALGDVHNDVFPNTRGDKTTPQHLANLSNGIGDNRHNEQIMAINCSLDPDQVKIGVYEGFSRTEAMVRRALAALIDEWNSVNNLSPGDPDYVIPINNPDGPESKKEYVPDCDYDHALMRDKIRQAGGEWQKKFDEALASYPIKIDLLSKIDDSDAFIRGVEGNVNRKDVSSWSLVTGVMTIITKFQVSGAECARRVGVTGAQISYIRSMSDLPANLKKAFEEDKEEFELTDADAKVTDICIDEFIRRCSLPKGDPEAVTLAHGRVIGQALRGRSKNAMNYQKAIVLLRFLCGIEEDGKLIPGYSTASSTLFKERCEAAKTQEALQEFTIDDADDDVVDVSSVLEAASELEGEDAASSSSIDDLIGSAESADDDGDDSDEDDDFLQGIMDADSEEEDISELLGDAADDSDEVEELEDEDDDEEGLNISDLVDAATEDAEEAVETNDDGKEVPEDVDGAKRTKTGDVKEKIETKPASKLTAKIATGVAMIQAEFDDADDGVLNWAEILAQCAALDAYADAVNDSSVQAQFSALQMELVEGLQGFMDKSIAFCRKTMSVEEYQKLEELLPSFSEDDFAI